MMDNVAFSSLGSSSEVAKGDYSIYSAQNSHRSLSKVFLVYFTRNLSLKGHAEAAYGHLRLLKVVLGLLKVQSVL